MLKNNLYKFNHLLIKNNKKELFLLIIISLVFSIIEIIGISALMPFITLIANPEIINENKYYSLVYNTIKLKSLNEFIMYSGILLILFYVFRGFFSIWKTYILNKFAMNKYNELVNKIFSNYIYMSYKNYMSQNSANLSKSITSDTSNISYIVQFFLTFISEVLILIIFYIMLLFIDLYMTIIITAFFVVMISILFLFVSSRIKRKGNELIVVQEKFYKIINETFGNFKFMKFVSNENEIYNNFQEISGEYKNIYTLNNTFQDIPRNFLETIGFSLIILLILLTVYNSENFTNVIPIIIMYALAFYRMLPAITRILTSYNGIVFYMASLEVVYDNILINNTIEYDNMIKYNDKIELKNIKYSYSYNKNIFNDLNLEIKKGQKIAFIGESGSGKSTLVDLICGIYRPDSGKVLIDGIELDNSNIVSWRKRIGYIPQAIYLFDGTISDNITFGRDYDEDRLNFVLKQSNIYDLIMQKEGLDTMVGEGGVQLSGGQKQRIGIARALYGDPEILVLDEATSALDTETESAIMDEVYKVSEGKTLMIIAHRLSTIEKCDIKIDVRKINSND